MRGSRPDRHEGDVTARAERTSGANERTFLPPTREHHQLAASVGRKDVRAHDLEGQSGLLRKGRPGVAK